MLCSLQGVATDPHRLPSGFFLDGLVCLVSLNGSDVPVGTIAYCGLCDFWHLRLYVMTHEAHLFSAPNLWEANNT